MKTAPWHIEDGQEQGRYAFHCQPCDRHFRGDVHSHDDYQPLHDHCPSCGGIVELQKSEGDS